MRLSTCEIVWDASLVVSAQYDFILCADCLFFDKTHHDLLRALKDMLKPNVRIRLLYRTFALHSFFSFPRCYAQGKCIMFAPKRGTTFDLFHSRAQGGLVNTDLFSLIYSSPLRGRLFKSCHPFPAEFGFLVHVEEFYDAHITALHDNVCHRPVFRSILMPAVCCATAHGDQRHVLTPAALSAEDGAERNLTNQAKAGCFCVHFRFRWPRGMQDTCTLQYTLSETAQMADERGWPVRAPHS